MYTVAGRIKYSEVGQDGNLMLHQLINYFQDCSTFHLKDLNINLEDFKLAFYMLSWQIEINRWPKISENIKVGTLMHKGKGAFGLRNYVMFDANDEILAYANMVGCFVDAQTENLVKLTEAQRAIFPLEEKLEMDYLPRKITLPDLENKYPAVIVSKYHIDMNHHVNNSQYAAIAMNYLPHDLKYKRVRVEYKQGAKGGAKMIPKTVSQNGVYYVALCNENNQPYVVLAYS